MSNVQHKLAHSPGYYVRQRFLRNIPAVFGLAFIILAILITVLGYKIMPDSTPNANDGAVQISKKPPGFTVSHMRVAKDMKVPELNFFEVMLFGQPSRYILVPVADFRVDRMKVHYESYGKPGHWKQDDLLRVTRSIFVGESDAMAFEDGNNYEVHEGVVTYLDLDEQVVRVSQDELTEEFLSEHIDRRTYLLGTDKAGRDLLSRLLFGTRISLAIGFIAVLISLLVGLSLGSMAGFFGGWVDDIIMWFMTVVWSIPGIMLVIAISLALQSKGIWVAFVAVGLTTWVEIARVVRGQIFAIRQKTYVEAAKALGLSNKRIILRHIMPNIMGPLIVIAAANFASAILVEAGLSFLGLGVQPPMPSWGMMVNEGFHSIGTRNSWHLIVFPSLAISMTVLAFNLLGNGLRDAYDPQTAG